MLKVLMVDDQIILRESLKFIIEQDNEIEVIGSAGNGMEALELCKKEAPDLILMDIMMPICDGVEGTKLIKELNPSIKVLILTTFNDTENVSKALQNGADGYILKNVKPDELILAIKSTAKGLTILHKNTFDTFLNQSKIKQNKLELNFTLSEQEIKIISLIVDGKSNKEISDDLHFAEGSIKNIISSILNKLKLRDRTQLAVFAVKNNLV